MPEHVHLLLGEPQRGDLSVVMKAVKQGFARCLLGHLRRAVDPKQIPLWQTPVERGRALSSRPEPERQRRRSGGTCCSSPPQTLVPFASPRPSPVQRGLVREPQDWAWSSFRHYAYDEADRSR